MSRLLARAGAVVAATAAALALSSVPAQADTRFFSDAKDHPWFHDVTKVKVTNGAAYVWVTAEVGSMITEDTFYLWLDTDAENTGPEYRGTVIPNSEWQKLRKVSSFKDNGKSVGGDCWVMGKADVNSKPTVVWKIKKSCMKNPSKVRASVKARHQGVSGIVNDWAPGSEKFFGWVSK